MMLVFGFLVIQMDKVSRLHTFTTSLFKTWQTNTALAETTLKELFGLFCIILFDSIIKESKLKNFRTSLTESLLPPKCFGSSA